MKKYCVQRENGGDEADAGRPELQVALDKAREALAGDSNDAEHDALVSLVEALTANAKAPKAKRAGLNTYLIHENAVYEVQAKTAKEALDKFLGPEGIRCPFPTTVNEREVTDLEGNTP